MTGRRRRLAGPVLSIIITLIAIAVPARLALAQAEALAVRIASPAEGETFYAGPSSLLYSIQVVGWVTSQDFEPTEVKVQLDILQGGKPAGTLTAQPQADGKFVFELTVNPNGSEGNFTPVEIEAFCDIQCHYRAAFDLPKGPMVLRVTASDPSGRKVSAERRIVVDLSGYASAPVHVVVQGQPKAAVAGLRVTGSTQLYLWRARTIAGSTDAQGDATVRVEALSQAPARYIFRVEPTVVDGVLYEGVEEARAVLPSGGTSLPPVTLYARGRKGQIAGHLAHPVDTPLTVSAVRLPQGETFKAAVSPEGAFNLANLPVAAYLLMLDPEALAQQGLAGAAQAVDLTRTVSATVELPVTALEGASWRAAVRDEAGATLPFAWASIEKAGVSANALPGSSSLTVWGLPAATLTAVAMAPGYYSQALVVHPAPGPALPAEMRLVRRPETQSLPWGQGRLTIPPETTATVAGHEITLSQGWLWGEGQGDDPYIIRTPDATITISSGEFALELLPERTAWLYLLQGSAAIEAGSNPEPLSMSAGQMLALATGAPLKPVALNPAVVEAMAPVAGLPLSPVWGSSVSARIRDGLAQMGIGAAQAVTFMTYSAATLLLVLAPLGGLYWWSRRRSRNSSASK